MKADQNWLPVRLERETGLEPATACLEGRNSTTELLPQIDFFLIGRGAQTRTADLLLPKQARYQLRHTPLHLLSLAESVCTIARLLSSVNYFSIQRPIVSGHSCAGSVTSA